MAKKEKQIKLKDKYTRKGDHETSSGALTDPRFKAALTDPRFQRFPKSQRTVEIDERFSGAYSDEQSPTQYKITAADSSKGPQTLHWLHACHQSQHAIYSLDLAIMRVACAHLLQVNSPSMMYV